jgi:hypothetical protein
MNRTQKWIAASAVALIAIGGGTGIAVASGGGDDDAHDTPISGPALDRASAAALAATGEGRVTATEVGDEEGYYEIEVTLDDGSQVDVHLDKSFHVLSRDADQAGSDEGAGDDS